MYNIIIKESAALLVSYLKHFILSLQWNRFGERMKIRIQDSSNFYIYTRSSGFYNKIVIQLGTSFLEAILFDDI